MSCFTPTLELWQALACSAPLAAALLAEHTGSSEELPEPVATKIAREVRPLYPGKIYPERLRQIYDSHGPYTIVTAHIRQSWHI
jgi:hypothetical protein